MSSSPSAAAVAVGVRTKWAMVGSDSLETSRRTLSPAAWAEATNDSNDGSLRSFQPGPRLDEGSLGADFDGVRYKGGNVGELRRRHSGESGAADEPKYLVRRKW